MDWFVDELIFCSFSTDSCQVLKQLNDGNEYEEFLRLTSSKATGKTVKARLLANGGKKDVMEALTTMETGMSMMRSLEEVWERHRRLLILFEHVVAEFMDDDPDYKHIKDADIGYITMIAWMVLSPSSFPCAL